MIRKIFCMMLILICPAFVCLYPNSNSSAHLGIANQTATLHAIIIADTFDDEIGHDVFHDLMAFKKESQKIAALTGLKLNQMLFHGESLIANDIVDHLASIQISENDTVIFYFSGHGSRTLVKGDNPWPDLFLSHEGSSLDYELLIEMLMVKKPRFILAIADCCNNIIEENWTLPNRSQLRAGLVERSKANEKANYRHLFLESSGLIMIAGSSAGQYAWSTRSGGLYSITFLKVMHEAVKHNQSDWESILELSSLNVNHANDVKASGEDLQIPYYIRIPF